MSDESNGEETTLRKHCKLYLKTYDTQRGRNIHPFYCHKRALSEADEKYRLTLDERKKRDAWLAGKSKDRFKEPEVDRGRSLFDDEKILRAE